MRLLVAVLLVVYTYSVSATDYFTTVKKMQIINSEQQYLLNADIDYNLSPIVKEALRKGISMSWTVRVKVKRKGMLWNSTINDIALRYQIQNHDVLNLYSVKQLNEAEKNMFSTLAGALDFIAKIRRLKVADSSMVEEGERYYVAVKVDFEHESLPVPIRPFSYFDKQWALSSKWMLWPLKN